MEGRKSLYDISWKVSEPEYRADEALSYSILAKYERNGRFNSIPTLFEKESTPSLTFGSIVDCLVTDGEEEFDRRFTVIPETGLSDTLKAITETLFIRYKADSPSLADIPDNVLADTGAELGYYVNEKFRQTRINNIRKSCAGYYGILMSADGKTAVTETDIADARACVEALRNSPCGRYLGKNNVFEPDIEWYYQLKFKGKDGKTGISYRCMPDCLVVDHRKGVITPVDLKTSSHLENEFYRSFTQYRYDIQARLYWRIVKQTLEQDDYYSGFVLMPWIFVVVNRNTLTPLAWEFKETMQQGTLNIDTPSGYTYMLRDPYEIGSELSYYLANPERRTPVGVSVDVPNNIKDAIMTR